MTGWFTKGLGLALVLLMPFNHSIAQERPIALVIHGGAGVIERDSMSPEQDAAYRSALSVALAAGYRVLDQGGSSLDAVTASIVTMENSPLFNAGVGAVYTHDETHELDASIMRGEDRAAGAIAGVKHLKNPIEVARLVMEQSVHVMLTAEGAETFAQEQGVELIDNSYFNTPRRLESLQRAKAQQTSLTEALGNAQIASLSLDNEFKMGTVGAVALDRMGNLAAGTSTGGMTNKRYGRVGDAPIIGAGTFADNSSCAVSATGHGEFFIRFNVAADICARVKYQQKSIADAAREVLFDVLLPSGGTGGVIVMDTDGNISMPFNTEGMYRAYQREGKAAYIAIYGDE